MIGPGPVLPVPTALHTFEKDEALLQDEFNKDSYKFQIPNFPAQNRGCNACHEPLGASQVKLVRENDPAFTKGDGMVLAELGLGEGYNYRRICKNSQLRWFSMSSKRSKYIPTYSRKDSLELV